MHLVSKGQIEVGKDADLCFLNNQLDITDVILNGEIGMKDQVIIKKVDTKNENKSILINKPNYAYNVIKRQG